MRITNETRYKTADLRAFFTPIARAELNAPQFKNLYVRVVYGRLQWTKKAWAFINERRIAKGWPPEEQLLKSSGNAYLDRVWAYPGKSAKKRVFGFHMRIILDPEHRADHDFLDLAHTLVHECGHVRGNQHLDMRGRGYYTKKEIEERYPELIHGGLKIGIEPEVKKTKRVHPRYHPTEVKLIKARKVLADREKKAKSAAALVKKWRQKVRYYERKLETNAKAAAKSGE